MVKNQLILNFPLQQAYYFKFIMSWIQNKPASTGSSIIPIKIILPIFLLGNGSELTETQMKRLILQPTYDCEDELQHCFNSCKLLLSMFEPILSDNTTPS